MAEKMYNILNADFEADDNDILKGLSPEYIQRKLYFYVNELKKMHAEIPEVFQVRISYELLTDLANNLLNETAFDIVKGLIEIQHTAEFNLKKQRDEIIKKHEESLNDWKRKNLDPKELQNIEDLLKLKLEKTLKETDIKIVNALDEKVHEQQRIMQKAGVPGFYVTNNAKEIKIQMLLFDLILRLSQMKFLDKK